MARRAILQIGTEKTGTTTLQHFLSSNREALAARNLRYPRFCGEKNHTGLAAYALADSRMDPIREPFGVRSEADVPAMRERMRRAAEVELADGADAIFCSEHCHSRLKTSEEVGRLRELLGRFFDEIEICVYLRRQDQVALSLYSTRLKSGGVNPRLLPNVDPSDSYYNYDRLLGLWEGVFGRERVHVRLFDRAELVGGSVAPDFLDLWDLGPEADYVAVTDRNGSLGPTAQEYLRRLNPHLAPRGGKPLEAVRGPIVTALERAFGGKGARPSRADAEAFLARYAEANEAVRSRHFPDRETHFSADFSSYPETADDRRYTLDDFAAVAARLHMDSQEEIFRLEAEVALREARLLWNRDQKGAAIAALRRALNWRPGHPEANRTLAEYMLREDRLDEAVAPARAAAEARPDSVEHQHFLGIVLRRTGDAEGALKAQERALALDPGHAAALRERDQLAARPGPAARAAGAH
jgi:tetratricopeptide (TPR) repeat protein